MKNLTLTLASVLFSIAALAQAEVPAASNQEKQMVLAQLMKDDMVKAAIHHNKRYGAACHSEVLKLDKSGEGFYDFEVRIICHYPDNEFTGGGDTLYSFTGQTSMDAVILQNIKIDYAG